ncbi:MAG: DUF192 domain-containing protein [Pseudomonadota bacterium]
MKPLRRWPCLSAVVVFILLAVPAWSACRDSTIELRGDWGQARFTVEVADTPELQSRGLMFRERMAQSAGMLFVYPRPRQLTFWMRNTLFELDILFIDPDGVVQHIHHRAQPLDETLIEGGRGLQAALEINGGLARRMGIDIGTQVRHPALPDAHWQC